MSQSVRSLEPNHLWNNFADLNAVPRASKKEERVIQFIVDFGARLNLETSVDDVGNVIIKKAATPGMEGRQTVVLQSHLDMVHQKNANTNFDFDTEGIKMLVEGDWVRADGTTLGADNGIGVAAIMTLLASDNIAHPALEALFTIDEETGMTGAMGLQGGVLSGTIMLNLDTEDDNELCIGCAGGVDVSAEGTYQIEAIPARHSTYKISVTGLTGGHSGMDIHLGRGNANKLMNRLLKPLGSMGARIASIDGGGLRNAIPRESFSIVAIPDDKIELVRSSLDEMTKALKFEYRTTDPDLKIDIQPVDSVGQVMTASDQRQFVNAIYACFNGIYRMTPEIEGLVQTSNNLARVELKDGEYTILCLTRSSVDSEKMDLADAIASAFELIGAKVDASGAYPGWAPKPDAAIIQTMSNIYREMYKDEPDVNACHAGLECGILGTNYPGMDMISFGPNIRGAHSPDEKVQISSVQKFWDFLMETLKRTPELI